MNIHFKTYDSSFNSNVSVFSDRRTFQSHHFKINWLNKFRLIFAFGAGFSGFQLLILGIHLAGVGYANRIFTVPYRIGFLSFSLLFILYGILKHRFNHIGRLWIPLLIFWFLYFFRIAMDGYLFPITLGLTPAEYIQKAFGVTFFPMIIFLIRLHSQENKIAFKAFWTVHLICLLLIILFYGRFADTGYRAIRYMGYDAAEIFSPVIISYMGAVTLVIGIQRFLAVGSFKTIRHYRVLMVITIAMGVFALVYGGTRSVILGSIILCMIIYYLSSSTNMPFFNMVKAFIIAVTFTGILFWTSTMIGAESISRFNLLIDQLNYDPLKASGGRLEMILNASNQFIRNPLLGSGLEEKSTLFHPHNNIIEAFMATGLLGGISFLILCYVAVKRSLIILKDYKEYGWIACLFLLFFFRGFFSSPLTNNTLWYLMMCVFSVPISNQTSLAYENR